MAKDAGLTLPEAKLFKAKRQYFFGAKRFDREADGSRLHMQTLSTLLNASPTSFSVSYDLFATVTQRLTEDVRQVQAAYRICAFNILSCNQDDHTKNVAFLMDSDGRWELAPAYDLTFSRTPYGEHKMDVDGNGKPSAEDLKEFGAKLGLTKTTVKRILDQVSHGVSRYKYHARKLEIPKREITKIADVIDPKLKVRRARAR